MNRTGLPCPFSGCGSSDAFSWHTEKQVGKCFSCDESYPQKGMVLHNWAAQEYPLKDNKNMAVDDMIPNSPKMAPDNTPSEGLVYKEFRGISPATMEFFGVKTNDLKQIYPYPNGTNKVRMLPKNFDYNKGFKADSLFGSNLFPVGCARKITVCEGELDAMSAHQMLSGGGYINPVVSLPSASPNGNLWENVTPYLESFDQIILSTDNDKRGREVAEVMFDLFPDKVHIMDHGIHKDANDFLLANAGKAYKSAWWSAKKYSPAGFTAGAEDWLKAVHEETPYEYTPTFSEALNEVTRGWVKGGITVVKAPAGTGKTSVFRAAQHDLVVKKNMRVGVLHMEELKSTTARGMATYHLGKNVNTQEDQEFYDVSNESLDIAISEVVEDNRFVAFEVNPQDPIEDTLKQAKYAVTVYGCDYLFIDHLQRLAYLSGVDGATAALTELGVRLVEFSKRRNVGIICISHVNETGHTKYAKSVEEEAIMLIELKRDMKAEGDDANYTDVEVTKNRPYSRLGNAGRLHYNPETTIVKGV
jgi:hypothetical protein